MASPLVEDEVIRVRASGKINLALRSGPRRSDGYHELATIFQAVSVYDDLEARWDEPGRFSVTMTGDQADLVPCDDSNLAVKAAALLARESGNRGLGCQLTIRKAIPVTGGMAGGSADAAATLHGLLALWAAPVSERTFEAALSAFALELGADVPMWLHGKPLIARGLGEHTETLAGFPAFPMLLVNPRVPVSTPAIFKALASKSNPPLALPEGNPSPEQWLAALSAMRNDLEPPARALCPDISALAETLAATDARVVRMSGSGASCFALYRSDEAAEAAAALLSQQHPHWFFTATCTLGADDGAH